MNETKKIVAASLLIALSPIAANAVTITDVTANGAAWAATTAGADSYTAYDFSIDADYGIEGFDGPLTNAGGGPVSAGNLAPGVTMNAIGGAGTPELVAVGPLAGFGNPENGVFANFFTDIFGVITFDSGPIDGFEFTAATLLGGSGVDIIATTVSGNTLFAGLNTNGELGNTFGLWADAGDGILSISINDALGGGAEGLIGSGTIYTRAVPEPGTLALIGLGLVAAGLRRRKTA